MTPFPPPKAAVQVDVPSVLMLPSEVAPQLWLSTPPSVAGPGNGSGPTNTGCPPNWRRFAPLTPKARSAVSPALRHLIVSVFASFRDPTEAALAVPEVNVPDWMSFALDRKSTRLNSSHLGI